LHPQSFFNRLEFRNYFDFSLKYRSLQIKIRVYKAKKEAWKTIPTSRTSTAGELRATALINRSNLVRVDAYRPDDTRNLGRIKGGGGDGDRAVRFAKGGDRSAGSPGGVRRFARRAESPADRPRRSLPHFHIGSD